MTSTISEPAVGSDIRDGRGHLRGSEVHAAEVVGRRSARALRGEPRRPRPACGDKVMVPQPDVPLLQRPRVTGLIEKATTHRVTLVCGPGGAGKTVACAGWAMTAPAANGVAWISLDQGDRSPRQLWAHIRSAIASMPAVPGPVTDAMPDAADDAFPVALAEIARHLTVPITLILDDISCIAESAAVPGLDQLLRHGPPALRLILSGRHPAGLQVARLRVDGDLAEIGASDLACTAEEAEGYFAMLGLDLPAADRDDLLSRTQGWMTGLRLAAMAAEPGKPVTVARITGDEPAVADYLWDEVLAGLPAERRLFLLRTSVAEVICGDLADVLTGRADGAGLLDQMCRENLMVSPASERAGPAGTCLGGAGSLAYRYHPLLLELLRARLHRELPGEVAQLTRRAARWQSAHGLPADAIRSAARAADWDFAGRVLAQAGPAMLLPGPAAELEPVIATFPAGRCTGDAAVAGALAAAGLRAGDTCAAALHLENAWQALRRSPPAQRRLITPWLAAVRLMNADPPASSAADLIAQSKAMAVQAQPAAGEAAEHTGLGLLWCSIGVTELACADVVQARDSLTQARRQLRTSLYREFGDRARSWQAIAEALYGNLLGASELIADGADQATDARTVTDPLSAQLGDLAAALVHWARDESAAARRALDRCEPADSAGRPAGCRALSQLVDPSAGNLVSSLIAVVRARLALGEGDHGTARALLTRLRYQSLHPGGHGNGAVQSLATTADLGLAPLEAEIALREGDVSRARLAMARLREDRAAGAREAGGQDRGRADLLLAHARVLLAQEDNHGALAAILPCLNGAAAGVTLIDHVSALVIAAMAHRKLGQPEQAADSLTSAMTLAEPQGMYRPFLDAGPAARSLLTALIGPASHGAAFAARILQRFDPVPAWPASQQPPGGVPLTSSELAVLRLLPSHMTNQEIAEALFLSINTVKTHLRSVYRKLGVCTRRQAISRSGRLGLL